ncbi:MULTISPECIES: RHS repeat domain-containing protein [unclassified Chryseobacterium]
MRRKDYQLCAIIICSSLGKGLKRSKISISENESAPVNCKLRKAEQTQSAGYTSNSSLKNVYDSNGILIRQNDNETGAMVWHLSDANSKGQTTQMEYGNGYTITNQYNPNDFSLFNIKHQNTNNGTVALDVDYNYDVNKGVLNWRRNNTFGKKEDFTYDKLNRLLSEAVNGVLTNEYTYDKRGRITSNTELGKYNYNETNYKLQGIDFNTNGQNVNTQRGFAAITYNAFKSPNTIVLTGKEDLRFAYNILKTRYSMTSYVTGKTKLYSSDFAVEITKKMSKFGETVEIITYITGDPYSANYIKKEILDFGSLTEKNNYYLHRDNLGSILAVTKTDGSVVEKRFFDAWGNLKALTNASGQLITDAQQLASGAMFLDRGYTGHEHLWKVGLINMNARLYDPVMRKFLSPDNLIPDPTNTQSYDRFGYAYNNPLLYVDIDGNSPLVIAIVVGVAIAVTTKVIMNAIAGVPIWYGLGKSAVTGAVMGAISFGIGSAATGAAASFVGKAALQAGMHGMTGGMMSVLEDGNFGSGFLSGAVSSIISSGIQALGTNFTRSGAMQDANRNYISMNSFGKSDLIKAVMVVSGGLSGGISSTIAGGNFWQGFRQGLITSGLNHVEHLIVTNIMSKNILAGYLVKNSINPYDPATTNSLKAIIALFTKPGQWVEIANPTTLADWSKGYLTAIVDSNQLIDLLINGAPSGSPAWGITNPVNGKIILAPRLLNGIEDNFWAASVVIHEQDHFTNFQLGLFQSNSYIDRELNELSAYRAAEKWTGTMEKQGFIHLNNVISYILKLPTFK